MIATDENVAAIPDDKLIADVRKWREWLCKSGGRDWRLCIPAHTDDPDVVMDELADRYEKALERIKELQAVVASLSK